MVFGHTFFPWTLHRCQNFWLPSIPFIHQQRGAIVVDIVRSKVPLNLVFLAVIHRWNWWRRRWWWSATGRATNIMLQLAARLEKVSHQDHAETQKDSLTSSHHSSTQNEWRRDVSGDESRREMYSDYHASCEVVGRVWLWVYGVKRAGVRKQKVSSYLLRSIIVIAHHHIAVIASSRCKFHWLLWLNLRRKVRIPRLLQYLQQRYVNANMIV